MFREFAVRVLNYSWWRVKDVVYMYQRLEALSRASFDATRTVQQVFHNQKSEVIITLTSHKPRFSTLHLTLGCLLRQTVRPDRVVLWIDQQDFDLIPEKVKQFRGQGLEIRTSIEKIRVYNKIVPALKEFPNAILVTVDDDIYYGNDFLFNLLRAWGGSSQEIVCNMAFEIKSDSSGAWLPFRAWKYVDGPTENRVDIMPFGVGGVLYPPGALPSVTVDSKAFLEMCPYGDDIWLYWMGRSSGLRYTRIAGNNRIIEWPFSQGVALKHENNMTRNDEQIEKMARRFGFPSLAD